MLLKGRGQGGWKVLELLNCTPLLDERLIKTGLCKKHCGQQHGGLQVLMGKVQVLFSGNACRMGLKGGRVRDEGNSAKSP